MTYGKVSTRFHSGGHETLDAKPRRLRACSPLRARHLRSSISMAPFSPWKAMRPAMPTTQSPSATGRSSSPASGDQAPAAAPTPCRSTRRPFDAAGLSSILGTLHAPCADTLVNLAYFSDKPARQGSCHRSAQERFAPSTAGSSVTAISRPFWRTERHPSPISGCGLP